MSSVIVAGGGPIGMATAILFAREGHDVTVLERDPQSPPASVSEAVETWERRGVAQFRQIHNLQPKFRHLLDAEFPEIRDALVASGARQFNMLDSLPPSIQDRSPRPGDESFSTLVARRVVAENAIARVAENTSGVKVLRGVSVQGPITDGGTAKGIPRVVGVRTEHRDTMHADLVIDAMGRGSKFCDWAAGVGARRPYEESSDTGFAYYTRHYRGTLPEYRSSVATFFSTFQVLVLPADNQTWACAIAGMAGDKPIKALRRNEAFEKLLRSIPSVAHWVEGEPVHDVVSMAGATDRYRRFVVDDQPVILGMVAVGDAWACTNPTAGRGLSMGLLHAVALRDVARNRFDDPYGLAIALDRVTEELVTPWYQNQRHRDRQRVASVRAAIDGTQPPRPDLTNPQVRMQRAFQIAAQNDPDVGRAFLEMISVLALPQEILGRPGMIEMVVAASKDRELREPEGPSRSELVEMLSDTA
jgi:2-polyprenyl-6-methoxyphenol hydroxylase-like FAD-dependent oxidoreductase